MKKKRKQRQPRAQQQPAQFVTLRGPARYTVDRFFGGCGDIVMIHACRAALKSGYQICTARVDYQLVPAMLILACWALNHQGIELVDDYPALLQAHREAVAEGELTAHPDLYLASCIALLAKRDLWPEVQTFEDVGVPKLFEELVQVEDV